MVDVTIYTSSSCIYCKRAKALLTQKGVAFREVDVTNDAQERALLVERASGRRTVPQIFVGQFHVGGCDDLYALEAEGGLDPLLVAS